MPPTLGELTFYNYDVPQDIYIYVPCESLEDYKAAEEWSKLDNIQCDENKK